MQEKISKQSFFENNEPGTGEWVGAMGSVEGRSARKQGGKMAGCWVLAPPPLIPLRNVPRTRHIQIPDKDSEHPSEYWGPILVDLQI